MPVLIEPDELETANHEEKEEVKSGLADHLWGRFRVAQTAKKASGVEDRIVAAHYAAMSEYTPEELCKIKTVDVYVGVFANQRQSLLAWMDDLISQAQGRPWVLEPGVIPDPPKWMKKRAVDTVLAQLLAANPKLTDPFGAAQAALREQKEFAMRVMRNLSIEAAQRHSNLIEDQLRDGGWDLAFAQFRDDFATHMNAFMVTADITVEKRTYWSGDKVRHKPTMVYNVTCPSPFDVYPMPDCTTTQNGEGIAIVFRYSRTDLIDLAEADDGFTDPDAIGEVLEKSKSWRVTRTDMMRDKDSGNSDNMSDMGGDGTYEVIRFWMNIDRKHLQSWKKREKEEKKSDKKRDSETDDPAKELEELQEERYIPVEVWYCNGEIIRMAQNNHPTGMRPIFSASFDRSGRSFWGKGLYDRLKGVEMSARKLMRETIMHAAHLSGLIGEVDTMRLDKNEVPNKITPWTLYKTGADYTRGGHRAFHFHQLPNNMGSLLQLMQQLYNRAEIVSGIPNYLGGATDVGTAGRTIGVMNALQVNAIKSIVQHQNNINKQVIVNIVRYFYDLNMAFHDDSTIKADLRPIIKGTEGIVEQEVKSGRIEKFLQYAVNLTAVRDPMTGEPLMPFKEMQSLLRAYLSGEKYDPAYLTPPAELDQITAAANPGSPMTADQMGSGAIPMDGRSDPRQAPAGQAFLTPPAGA